MTEYVETVPKEVVARLAAMAEKDLDQIEYDFTYIYAIFSSVVTIVVSESENSKNLKKYLKDAVFFGTKFRKHELSSWIQLRNSICHIDNNRIIFNNLNNKIHSFSIKFYSKKRGDKPNDIPRELIKNPEFDKEKMLTAISILSKIYSGHSA